MSASVYLPLRNLIDALTGMGEEPGEHVTDQDAACSGQSASSAFSDASALTAHRQIYAGAPMNKQIGDRIAAEGVALIPFYGSSVLTLPRCTHADPGIARTGRRSARQCS